VRAISGLLLAALLAIAPAPPAAATVDPYVGQAISVAFDFCPVGWVRADGSLLAIAEYDTLFTLYGTTYGGDGVTTFAVPDLRGRGPIGAGAGPGLSTRTQGQQGGVEETTLTTVQLPLHTHPLRASTSDANATNPAGALFSRKTRTPTFRGGSPPDTLFDSSAITPAGGGQPHENMPPFSVINWCVAAYGIFPTPD
jgi:microcystin-dependent protein